MAAQKGILILLKHGDGASPEVFTTVGGLQTSNASFNNGQVDVTSADDTSRFRQLLAGAGVRSMSISGNGVFKDDAGIEAVRAAAAADTHDNWEVTWPDWGTWTGAFQISSFEFSGDHDGEAQWSFTIESAGDLTWAAA